jgi:hypothetical protein
MATKSQSLIDLGKQVLAENKAPVETPVATAPEVSAPVNQPATPSTVLPPTPVAPVETPTAPAPVSLAQVETPVAPVMDNKPATPSTVQAPTTPKPTAEDKKVQETTNQALAINKMVDKNRAN